MVIKNIIIYYHSLDKFKKAFWIYLFLIFIEGSMRKWFMPGLSSVWMMCREPIVIWTVLTLVNSKYLKSAVAKTFMVIGLFMLMTTLAFGHSNLMVALFGFRIWFFHIPYIFIMSQKLNREDLIRICQFLLIMFLPMTVIYVMQWAAPPSAWINAQVGGIVAAEGQNAAYGALRPSGIFAHCAGSVYYNPIVVAIFIAMMFSPFYKQILSPIKKEYLLLGIAVVLTLITSVSRGTVIQSIGTALFVAILLIFTGKTKYFGKLLIGFCMVYILFNVLSDVSIAGKNLLDPITSRFEDAAETEGGTSGIIDSRILEPYRFWNDKGKLLNPPFFGYGIGAGSNFGTQMLGLGTAWGLGEWSSQIVTNEMGFLFGGIVFFLRVGFSIYMLPKCLRLLTNNNDILPICLWTLSINYFGNGNINLTMTLGWIVVVTILFLLSIRTSLRINE